MRASRDNEVHDGMTKLACPAFCVDLRRTAVRNLRRAGVAASVIMKITGHRTRGAFERYNITDQSDTPEAGRLAEQFLAKEHDPNLAQPRHKIRASRTDRLTK